MYDLKCKHCGAPIMEYRGSWFSRGDESRCQWDGPRYHAPDQRELLRKHVRSALRGGVTRQEADQIVDEESRVGATR